MTRLLWILLLAGVVGACTPQPAPLSNCSVDTSSQTDDETETAPSSGCDDGLDDSDDDGDNLLPGELPPPGGGTLPPPGSGPTGGGPAPTGPGTPGPSGGGDTQSVTVSSGDCGVSGANVQGKFISGVFGDKGYDNATLNTQLRMNNSGTSTVEVRVDYHALYGGGMSSVCMSFPPGSSWESNTSVQDLFSKTGTGSFAFYTAGSKISNMSIQVKSGNNGSGSSVSPLDLSKSKGLITNSKLTPRNGNGTMAAIVVSTCATTAFVYAFLTRNGSQLDYPDFGKDAGKNLAPGESKEFRAPGVTGSQQVTFTVVSECANNGIGGSRFLSTVSQWNSNNKSIEYVTNIEAISF